MMKNSFGSKLLKVLLVAFLSFGIFAFWYKWQYSMEPVIGYEVNTSDQPTQILIATQGSSFKNAILEGVINRIARRDRYIKVMDVMELDRTNGAQWDVILIIHTWEMGKPPTTVMPFFNTLPNNDRLVIFNTAGDQVSHIDNVDAITGASNMEDVPHQVKTIVDQIERILSNNQDKFSANDYR